MIAISSHRPHSDSAEIAANQIRAHESWQKVFDEILYFGPPEAQLTCDRTTFLECEDFPKIKSLITAASLCSGIVCLLNADIIVAPHLNDIMANLQSYGALAATSQRYQFQPGQDLKTAKVSDYGVDFFAADATLWKRAALHIPDIYRIGHNSWDSWLLGFFNHTCNRRFFDITRSRCIFHPVHHSRKRVYSFIPIDDQFSKRCGLPFSKL
jgi:hypothetical protein